MEARNLWRKLFCQDRPFARMASSTLNHNSVSEIMDDMRMKSTDMMRRLPGPGKSLSSSKPSCVCFGLTPHQELVLVPKPMANSRYQFFIEHVQGTPKTFDDYIRIIAKKSNVDANQYRIKHNLCSVRHLFCKYYNTKALDANVTNECYNWMIFPTLKRISWQWI